MARVSAPRASAGQPVRVYTARRGQAKRTPGSPSDRGTTHVLQSREALCSRRTAALDWVVLGIGTLLGVVSLTADLIGVGAYPGFGWKQALGTAVALVLVGVGSTRILRRERRRKADEPR